MKNLEDLTIDCMDELKAIGIETGNVKDVKVNYRAKGRLGLCSKRCDGYYIEICNDILKDDIPDNITCNVIIHELLHTCKDCMCHTGQWKIYANMVNRSYSKYNIQRCSTEAELKAINYKELKMTGKYAMKCEKCGKIIYRDRMSDFVRFPGLYEDRNCGGNFVRIK
jgi:hypothetical protein